MKYAVAEKPTPLRRLLSPESYDSTGPDLDRLFEKVLRAREHYYAEATMLRRAQTLETVFGELANDWIVDTRFQSSMTRITSHPAYRKIISLGQEVLPLILRDLATSPKPWFAALREITGTDPVQPHERGNVRAMTSAWLRWAQNNNIRW